MDFFEVIKQRKSYRGAFTGEEVPREDVERIVQTGLDAPSGANGQTTCFTVVDDPELLARIGAMEGCKPCVKTARAIILCIVERDPQPVYAGMEFQVEDCAAAVENMLLACTALGYASVWIDGWLRREGRAEQLGEWIGLPDDRVIRVMLPIGIPTEPVKGPPKKPFAQRVTFNRFAS